MNFPLAGLWIPPWNLSSWSLHLGVCVCACVHLNLWYWLHRWLLFLSTFSFPPSCDYLSFSLVCSMLYILLCRPAPTGLMHSIGVHWIACMAAVAWQPALLPQTHSLRFICNSMMPVDTWHVPHSPEWSHAYKHYTNFKSFILFCGESRCMKEWLKTSTAVPGTDK